MSQSSGLPELAEKQMRNWALQLEIQQRLADEGEPPQSAAIDLSLSRYFSRSRS